MTRITLLAGLALLGFCLSLSTRGDAQSQAEVRQSFDMLVRHEPRPVRVAGRQRLVYELTLTNLAREPLDLVAVEVVDDDARPIAAFAGEALAAIVEPIGGAAEASRLRVESGRVAIVYVELDLPADRPLPRRLAHRLRFAGGRGSGGTAGGEAQVANGAIPSLGPPLRGGPWAAVYDPRLTNGHRRFVYATTGRAIIPGRHAIDWMAAAPMPGDGFGAEVLAVADGRVIALHDGMPEPEPRRPRPRLTLAEAAGNFIALDIGGGMTAYYEHLAPGLRVRLGDRVARGAVIGQVGSTGQANRPHLHFHVSTGSDSLASEGIPFALEGARIVGSYATIGEAARGGAWTETTPLALGRGGDQTPPPNSVVRFD